MLRPQPILRRLLSGDLSLIFYLSLIKFLFHLIVNAQGGYGLFRDEYYYLACADHLAAGYVDHPPFSIYVLKLITFLFGDSLFVVRLIPAIAGSLTIFVTGLIAIRLGGSKFAQFLSCLCSFSLITLAMNAFYSMNSIDILAWALVTYIMILIIDKQKEKYWIILGVTLGLALLNKISVLFLGAGLFVGLLITPQRKWFKTKWPYIAGVIALVLFSPYIIWNITHDLAHLEFIRNASAEKYSSLSRIGFIKDQFLLNNPVASAVWIAGLISFFAYNHFKKYHPLLFLYVIPFIILIANGTSKAEYLAAGYSTLWAAGSVWLEKLTEQLRFRTALRAVYCLLFVTVLFVLLPVVVPVLPIQNYLVYSEAIGLKPESNENKELAELPQFYADMFGWEQKVQDVAKVYNSLSEEDKNRCAIFASNYGRCGAIDYFGGKYGLPKAIGNHNNYWIWGPGKYTGELVIILGGTYDNHKNNFEEVKQVATSDCQYCMPYEDDLGIFLCKKATSPLQEIWLQEKHFE